MILFEVFIFILLPFVQNMYIYAIIVQIMYNCK